MRKDPGVYLAHILECIQKIERFTAGGREGFLADELPGLKRAIAALLPPLDQLERELAGEDEPKRNEEELGYGKYQS